MTMGIHRPPLTEQQKEKIRLLKSTTEMTVKDLAKRFDCREEHITKAVREQLSPAKSTEDLKGS
jgi:hypothetical protein